MRLLLPFAASLLLSACAAPPPSAPAPAADGGPASCNAEAAQSLVGQPATPANIEAARVAAGAASVRALKPDQPTTMDYRHDRVNVLEDGAGTIARISCG